MGLNLKGDFFRAKLNIRRSKLKLFFVDISTDKYFLSEISLSELYLHYLELSTFQYERNTTKEVQISINIS